MNWLWYWGHKSYTNHTTEQNSLTFLCVLNWIEAIWNIYKIYLKNSLLFSSLVMENICSYNLLAGKTHLKLTREECFLVGFQTSFQRLTRKPFKAFKGKASESFEVLRTRGHPWWPRRHNNIYIPLKRHQICFKKQKLFIQKSLICVVWVNEEI